MLWYPKPAVDRPRTALESNPGHAAKASSDALCGAGIPVIPKWHSWSSARYPSARPGTWWQIRESNSGLTLPKRTLVLQANPPNLLEALGRIELPIRRFADVSLSIWLQSLKILVALPGFEPGSADRESAMLATAP